MIGDYYDPRKEFGKAVTELAAENPDIVVFSADSGKSSGFGDFMKEYPTRYIECGIMEQGVVGVAAGMATTGKIPVFCAIAPFVTGRPYEMIRNDVGYMRQNVKLVGRNCGLTYSDLGSTHQGLDDFGLMRLIPGVTILAPQDPVEIKQAVKAMIEHKGPVYMRIGNPKEPQIIEEQPFVIGKGNVLAEGDDVTIITTGSCTRNVLKALPLLEERGIKATVIGMPTVLPIDSELVRKYAEKTGKVVTVEEHYVDCGLGSIVSGLLEDMPGTTLRRIGVPKEYGKTCGDYDKLIAYYKMDAEGITEQVSEYVGR